MIGPEWQDALKQLTACTCTWTVTRKTGLRVVNVQDLPEFLSMAAGEGLPSEEGRLSRMSDALMGSHGAIFIFLESAGNVC